ncbi:hypothetical protein O181_000567 [Austropuccinia psidii MF-1]|uniref:Uncharacterized protein n=1 Tax=Austropuccinia psidii MF-1 TaxID=1389203 RepID=A0A9Q3B8X1_9BASI|nr:hypothetical protein [Austropuccinia psidii MF-1]
MEGSIPTGCRPIYSSSEVPISRINNKGVVKRIRRISGSRNNPYDEGSDGLNGEEVEVLSHSKYSKKLPTCHIHFKILNSSSFTSRPSLDSPIKPYYIPQPRPSPVFTSQKLQPVTSTSRRREDQSPLPFPDTQVFQRRESLPIRVAREDKNVVNEGQNSVARLLRQVHRNSKEVMMYSNDRMTPGTTSKEMDAKSSWYEDELINDFQGPFDDFGRDK